ncbi:fibronectin type III domain-containing protein [Saccharothrix hoggarensis]|uniref:Fibronectin type III domain-containing protein n=1 Tax=Saccharothrix hoggarensis TaxID=913853 RepID=A0ABW3QQS4_9PSEU
MRGLLAVLVLLLAACGQEQHHRLTATLTSPTDVALAWEPERGVAGQVVEYAHEPGGPYTVLEFAPPGRTTHEHPDLIPHTSFYYRVRPFHGPVSATVDVTLPPGDAVPDSDDHAWAEPVSGPSGTHPVRPAVPPSAPPASPDADRASSSADPTTSDAAPGDFHAEVKHANGILFTWTDHAAGEDGYLLEVRPAGATDFTVAAQLDPDVRSFGLITLPTEKTAAYRVRAYYHGAPSTVAHQRTGDDQSR